MKKVIVSKKAKKTISATIVLIGLLGLLGKEFIPPLIEDAKQTARDYQVWLEDLSAPVVEVPSTIETLNFEAPEDEEDKNTYVSLDELKKYKAYLIYYIEKGNVFYDVEFLDEVANKDYIAYYKALDGKLEALDSDPSTKLDKKGYLKYDVIYLGEVYDDLTNPEISEYVANGIDFENNTISRKSYILYELGYISRHSDQVSKEVEELRRTRIK